MGNVKCFISEQEGIVQELIDMGVRPNICEDIQRNVDARILEAESLWDPNCPRCS